MKEFWKNLKNWQKGGVIFVALLMVAVAVILVVVLTNNDPKIKLEFASSNNIPASELKKVRQRLWNVVKDNTKDFNDSVVYVGKVRDYKETPEDNDTVADFVVNFDELKQSYQVMVTWPERDKESPNVVISCALMDGDYPETPCVTEVNSTDNIMDYLPYIGKTESGSDYKVSGKYSGGKLYLEIKTNGDIDEAVVAAKKWMSSIGFNPDDYLLYAAVGKYIQLNHSTTADLNVNEKLPYFVPNVFYVYPVVDENGSVKFIKADLPGCTDYQTDSAEEQVRNYLNNNGISYPVEFEYCVN